MEKKTDTTNKVISEKQLKEAIKVMVKKTLQESNHFTAMRNIQHMATSTSMEFEKNIVDSLGLMNPDHMQPDLQSRYFSVVQAMKEGIVDSVMNAAKELIGFPREKELTK
jgi:hypothetical protein